MVLFPRNHDTTGPRAGVCDGRIGQCDPKDGGSIVDIGQCVPGHHALCCCCCGRCWGKGQILCQWPLKREREKKIHAQICTHHNALAVSLSSIDEWHIAHCPCGGSGGRRVVCAVGRCQRIRSLYVVWLPGGHCSVMDAVVAVGAAPYW